MPSKIPLDDAVRDGDREAIAFWLERNAAAAQSLVLEVGTGHEGLMVRERHVAALLQAAGTYRLALAQERTASLLKMMLERQGRG